MADNRTYYVFCADGCKFEGMTKEQILTAIKQAVENGNIQDIDTGFITKIIEQNKQTALSFWIGTTAEYNAATNNGTNKNKDYHYIITDEINQYENLVTEINKKSTHYDLPSAKSVVDYGEIIKQEIKENEETIVKTAQGKVISIESSEAPFAGMQLYGETTQPEVLGENVLPYPYNELTTVQWYKNNVLFTDLGDGRIQLSGTATGGANITLTRDAQLNTTVIGRKYRWHCVNAQENGVSCGAEISWVDGAAMVKPLLVNNDTFTAESTTIRVCVTLGITSGVTYDCIITPKIELIESPLVSVGDSGSFEVGVYGRNILNHGVTTQTKDGLTITVNSDKSITVNGTATSAISLQVLSYRKNTLGGLIFSGCPTGGAWGKYCFAVHLYKNDSTYIGNVCDVGGGIQIPESDICMICLEIGKGVTVNNLTFYPMISTARGVEYEPYKAKQTLTMPYTLRSLGEVKDEIDFARGVLIQRVYAIDLSTLNWRQHQASRFLTDSLTPEAVAIGVNELANALCDIYTIDKWDTINNMTAAKDKTIAVRMGSVYVCDKSYTDVESFKASLTNSWLIYSLATPIETPLTETELNAYRQLHTNKPNTNIFSEASATVDYYANNENAQAVGNVHLQANNDYFKLQQAILSLGGNV